MAGNKTRENQASVAAFLSAIDDTRKRSDARKIAAMMKKLSKYKTGRSCLYLNKLDDVDENVLEVLIDKSVNLMRKRYNVK